MYSKKVCVFIYLFILKFISLSIIISGETTVGRHNQSDIQLTGALVARDHW